MMPDTRRSGPSRHSGLCIFRFKLRPGQIMHPDFVHIVVDAETSKAAGLVLK